MAAKSQTRLIHMVAFELNSREYGIPVTAVKEVIKVGDCVEIPNAPAFIAGVINLRGNILCVIDLRKQFNFPAATSEDCRIMVIRMRSMIVGLIVDQVHEVLKVPQNQIDPVPKIVNLQIPGNCLVGIAKVEKRIVTLLNLDNILTPDQLAKLNPETLEIRPS